MVKINDDSKGKPTRQEYDALVSAVTSLCMEDQPGRESIRIFWKVREYMPSAYIRVLKRNDGSRLALVQSLRLGVDNFFLIKEVETPDGVELVAEVLTVKESQP